MRHPFQEHPTPAQESASPEVAGIDGNDLIQAGQAPNPVDGVLGDAASGSGAAALRGEAGAGVS